MRKLLLGTTALAAAVSFSANALADVSISGYYEWRYESRSSKVTAYDGTTFNTDSEVKMTFSNKTDSGLDVDAMKLVAEGVNSLRNAGRGFLVITHYQRLLDHIKPDVVHIMAEGRIVKTGGPELALEVENNGYSDILAEVA